MNAIYRFPGITPFSERDQAVFFGRDADIETLYNSVLLNQCTVVCGKSGVGKTSLIYAGLIPRIVARTNSNEKDERFFVMLPVRPGTWTANESSPAGERTLVSKILEQLGGQQNVDAGARFLDALPAHLKNSLWYQMKCLQLQSTAEQSKVFLLIFDQVEEMFTYPFAQFKKFIKELKDIVTGNLPDDVREAMEDLLATDPTAFAASAVKVAYQPIPLKLLFAVRSDKLSLLNRLREAIPHIFQNFIELRPLSRMQARRAIYEPTRLEGNFITPPFQIENETIDNICDFLEQQQSTDLDSNFEDLRIEPFTLQIICQHIERNILPNDQDKKIAAFELGNPDDIIKNYYTDVLDNLHLEEASLRNVTQLIENKMIYEPDQRRLILYKEIITNEYQIPEALLDKLVQAKLLRELQSTGTKPSYEISHDWLVIPILMARKERQSLQNAQTFSGTILELEEAAKKNPNDYSIYKRMGDYYYFLKDYDAAAAKYSEAISKKEQAGNNEGDIDLYFNRADCYVKLKDYTASIKDLQRIIAQQPDHLLANYYIGFNYHSARDYEQAKLYYEKVVQLDATYASAYYNLGIVNRELNDLYRSYQDFTRAIQLNSGDYEAHYRLGVLCVAMALQDSEGGQRQKLQDEAILHLKKSIELQPDYNDAYLQLAYMYHWDLQMPDAAIAILQELLNRDSRAVLGWKTIGSIYKDQKNFQDAIAAFFMAMKLNPDDPDVYYYLGLLSNDQQRYKDAVGFLAKCIRLKNDYINAYIEKAFAHRMLQQLNEASVCYNQILELEPGNKDALLGLQKIESYANSEAEMKGKLESDPNNVDLLLELGVLLNNKQAYSEATVYLERALAADPQHIESMIELAYARLELKETAKAVEYYQRIIRIDPENKTAYRSIAKVQESLGETEAARQAFEKAVALDPSDHESLYRLGVMANDREDYETAINIFTRILAIKPDQTNAMTEKGYALFNSGKHQEALECYKSIVALEPRNEEIFYKIGIIYSLMQDDDQAYAYWEQATIINPAFYDAFLKAGELAHRNADYARASRNFDKCIELAPEKSEPYRYLAFYLYSAKDYNRAIKYYEKLVQLEPANANAFFNLALAYKETNQLPAALAAFKKVLEINPDDKEAQQQAMMLAAAIQMGNNHN